MSVLESAKHIHVDSQRRMMRDLCLVMLGLVGVWLIVALALPGLWTSMKDTRSVVVGNFFILMALAGALLFTVQVFRSHKAVQISAAVLLTGCVAVTVAGVAFSGFGVRAQAFHILLVCLPFVAFQYGRRQAFWFFGFIIGTVMVAACLEFSGVIQGATSQHQPFALVNCGLALFVFITLNLLFLRFHQRTDDLTQLHHHQHFELEQSLQLLKASLTRKRIFAKLLSHSTRTPLAGIQFAMELLKRPSIPDGIKSRTLASLSRHAFRLRMMSTHLELSRFTRDPGPSSEAGTAYRIDPFLVWNTCLRNLSPEASCKQISLSFDVKDAESVESPWEPVVLAQIVQVLVDNAIKAQSGGSIYTTFAMDSQGCFILEVADQGCGMSESRAKELLKPLGFASDEDVMLHGDGMGLGLQVVRSLCDLRGGWCGFRPVLSNALPDTENAALIYPVAATDNRHGSVFWIKVPLRNAAAEQGSMTDAADSLAPSASSWTDPARAYPSSPTRQPLAEPASGLNLMERSDRLFRRYLGVAFMLSLLGLLNFFAQALQGNEAAGKGVINSFFSLTLIAACMVLHKRGKHAVAVGGMIAVILMATFNVTIIIGLGVRAPIIILPVAAIALAHFQFGARGGKFTTLASSLIVLLAYQLERLAFVPGTEGALFPQASNAVIVLTIVYTLSFIAALELQGRSEIMLESMKLQNDKLQSAVHTALLADHSQSRFLLAVSPNLIMQCKQLAQCCDEFARQSTLDNSTANQLRAEISQLNASVIAAFDDAIGAVQEETGTEGENGSLQMAA